MRLHFGFITAIMGWIGLGYYEYLYDSSMPTYLKIFFIIAVFTAYGVNQVINDYFGLEEDRINAPNRPMVTGELNPKIAVGFSILLMVILGIISFVIRPLSVYPLIAGVLLNILYEYAKGTPLWGNIVFGLSITSCTVYGFLFAGPLKEELFTPQRIFILVYLSYINGLMTYYTYFKDYEGDKKTNKKTFIVVKGLDYAKKVGVIFSIIPTLMIVSGLALGMIWFPISGNNTPFWFCLAVTCFLQLWTAGLYYCFPTGEKTYYNLVTNIQACVSGQIAMVAFFDQRLSLYLLAISYILIGFVFSFYSDAKS